jgi:hypothetical protein
LRPISPCTSSVATLPCPATVLDNSFSDPIFSLRKIILKSLFFETPFYKIVFAYLFNYFDRIFSTKIILFIP